MCYSLGLDFLDLEDKDYAAKHRKCFSKNLIQYAVDREMRIAIDPSKAWAAGTLIFAHEINKGKCTYHHNLSFQLYKEY